MSGTGPSRRSPPVPGAPSTPAATTPAEADGGGLRHGRRRIVQPDGSVEEGCHVQGLLHGERPLRDREGRTVAWERWRLGRLEGSGPAEGEDGPGDEAPPGPCRQGPAQ
ncbi:MAG: hypothetical protein F4103_13355 [Boseongicola sp. SB0673_bin_14]|nr:hypothetical protein [Boseongicola sp. SB0673_bin_14]